MKKEQRELRGKIPHTAKRVKVDIPSQGLKWIDPIDLDDSHLIQTAKSGLPLIMTKVPGRKEIGDQPIDTKDFLKGRMKYIENDPLVKKSQANSVEDPIILKQIVQELAEEAAYLDYVRIHKEKFGDYSDGVRISKAKVSALKSVAEVWMRRADQTSAKGIDVHSDGFRKLLRFMMETFRASLFASGKSGKEVEEIFQGLSELLDEDWLDRAATIAKETN